VAVAHGNDFLVQVCLYFAAAVAAGAAAGTWYVLDRLLGRPPAPAPEGAQLKLNLLLTRLPRLRSGIDPRTAFAGTFHVRESATELETAGENGLGSSRAPQGAGA